MEDRHGEREGGVDTKGENGAVLRGRVTKIQKDIC